MSRFQRKISHASIRQVWQKYQETGSPSDLPRSWRSKVLNEREERTIVRNFLANPGTSIKSQVAHQARVGKPVSRRTLRRRLRSHGLVPKTSARGKEITKKNVEKRFKWAKMVQRWILAGWRSIVFSDECLFFPKRIAGRVIWCQRGEPTPHDGEPNLHYKSIKAWAFISYNGNRGIVRYLGTLKAKDYLEILKGHL